MSPVTITNTTTPPVPALLEAMMRQLNPYSKGLRSQTFGNITSASSTKGRKFTVETAEQPRRPHAPPYQLGQARLNTWMMTLVRKRWPDPTNSVLLTQS